MKFNPKDFPAWLTVSLKRYKKGVISEEDNLLVQQVLGIDFKTLLEKRKQNTAEQKKQQILAIAQSTAPKPSAKNDKKLAKALSSYIYQSSAAYDPKFAEQIRALRPDWFITATHKKQKLLAMAERGEARPLPSSKDPLAKALITYIFKTGKSYDPVFDKQIRSLRPDWFVTQSALAAQKKQQLLDIAKKGEAKPYHKNNLGQALSSYTIKTSSAYDIDFEKQIRELRPDWFITKTDVAAQKKKKLLTITKKPSSRAKNRDEKTLGYALNSYINKNSNAYDATFDQQIRRLRPEWFKS